MIKILLCCGGGFSSSYIATRMTKEIKELNMEEQVMMEFLPFSLVLKRYQDFDVVICCPHLYIYVQQLLKKESIPVPIYVLPPKMYGHMEFAEVYQDVLDVIDIYRKTKQNPVCFPGENNVLKIKRQKAYRHCQ